MATRSAWRYAGDHLSLANGAYDVQKQNMGMLELVIDKLVPGAQEVLSLSLAEFTLPGREIGVADMHYLNGSVHYLTKPNPQGACSVVWRDFIKSKTRALLELWFRKMYDEETGLMLPMSVVKATGFVVLAQSDGTGERAYRLEGVVITKRPEIAIKFESGEAVLLATELAVDRVIPENSIFNPQD